ncbi:hypothetical protein, partial [Corynebacterium sp. ES2715-CONJ3]|uniref:hypothetical protein n=1 Tax=Corynebacterium sp. ES2715-CONJ3 TaxID=2974028 RepID=UPI00216A5528
SKTKQATLTGHQKHHTIHQHNPTAIKKNKKTIGTLLSSQTTHTTHKPHAQQPQTIQPNTTQRQIAPSSCTTTTNPGRNDPHKTTHPTPNTQIPSTQAINKNFELTKRGFNRKQG